MKLKLLICTLIIALAGCRHSESPRDQSSQSTEKKPARAESSLDFSHALLGHWESLDDKEQYYMSPDVMTFYYAEDDRLGSVKYIILYQYPKSRTIEIRVQDQGAMDFKEINDRKFVFSADYKMTETYHKADIVRFLESIGKKVDDRRPPEYMQSSSWRYVDDKQRP
jgi:hypothetical protein